MTELELVKKKRRRKRSLESGTRICQTKTFPTLAHIVLSNGFRVDIPKLPLNGSQLTSYENIRIALEHVALAISCVNQLGSGMTPRLAMDYNLAPIRLNLEDSMNHLYFAIEDFHKSKGSS